MRFFANELRFYDKNQANGIAIEKNSCHLTRVWQ